MIYPSDDEEENDAISFPLSFLRNDWKKNHEIIVMGSFSWNFRSEVILLSHRIR